MTYRCPANVDYEKALRLRHEHNMPLREIANQIGVSVSTVSRWVNNKCKPYGHSDRKPPVLTDIARAKMADGGRRGNAHRVYVCRPLHELKNITSIRKRIFAERGRKCEICGWAEVNPFTGIIPVQIHHKNGDNDDNREENIVVVCPNHHALTEHYMFYGKSHTGTWGKKGTKRYR